MSLSLSELNEHCTAILRSRRIQNKIVILCEGNLHQLNGRPSPQSYRQLEKVPDANFYKACIPSDWTQHRPEFFVCGDKHDVISS